MESSEKCFRTIGFKLGIRHSCSRNRNRKIGVTAGDFIEIHLVFGQEKSVDTLDL